MSLFMTRRGRSAVLGATLALAAGMVPGTVSAGPPAVPADCADIMPTNQVSRGDRGRGWTVVRGDTPQRFRVEVLGILDDGIAPGRDLIIIEVRDVAGSDFIEQAGGIWSGMSGSPVYIEGRLIGAVAYGFTGSPSPVGGVTPAQDMADVLGYAPASSPAGRQDAARIRVPAHMRADLAARAGISESRADELSRLPIPFAVSGLSARGRERFQERLEDMGIPAIVTRGSTARTPTGSSTFGRPVPGGNFAGIISYGDITAGGIGTTTYVCGDRALAFGHPLTFSGRTTFGANDANAIRIVRDSTFGSFKLASIAELFGTVDQDRLTAIRGDLGNPPPSIPVTSFVRDVDTGNTRNGESDVTTDDFVPTVGFFHAASNIDVTIDRVGGGSSRVRWTVTGRDADGDPWTLSRANRYADPSDISFSSAVELADQLAAILGNRFENVRFDSVDIEARVQQAVKRYDIERLKISRNGGPFRERNRITVRPGDQLDLKVGLRQYRGPLDNHVLSLTVPDTAAGFGFLSVAGGGEIFNECVSDPAACPGNGFRGLLQGLEDAPRNDDLIADLQFFEGGEGSARTSDRLDRVIFGLVEVEVFVQ